jgi:glycosyltransferase involved in cell wall biosynthesis
LNQNILIVIPAYNCEKQIERVLEKLKEHTDFIGKILVIENCSEDLTYLVAQRKALEFSVSVEVLKNSSNIGLGGSLKRGFDIAIKEGYTGVVVIHGDDQANFADIRRALLKNPNRQIIVGARFHPNSKLIGYSLVRKLGNLTLNSITGLLFSTRIYDMIAGLNYFKTSFLKSLPYGEFENDLTFDSNILFWSLREEVKIEFAPITWIDEDQVSNAKVIRQTIKILKNLIRVRYTNQLWQTK